MKKLGKRVILEEKNTLEAYTCFCQCSRCGCEVVGDTYGMFWDQKDYNYQDTYFYNA